MALVHIANTIEFSFSEVRKAILGGKNGKARSLDGLVYAALKYDASIGVLVHLFNLCYEHGILPLN